MKVKSVYHKKEDRANQSPAPSARSVIVQPDVVVGGGRSPPPPLQRAPFHSKKKKLPPLSSSTFVIEDPVSLLAHKRLFIAP